MIPGQRRRVIAELAVHTALGFWLIVIATAALRLVGTPTESSALRTDLGIVIGTALVISFMVRMARAPIWLHIASLCIIEALTLLVLVYGERVGRVPTVATWRSATTDIADFVENFATAVPPIAYGAPWEIVIVGTFALAVIATLVLALSASGRAEALIPGALSAGAYRIISRTDWFGYAAVLVAAGVIVVAVLRSYHLGSRRIVGATDESRRERWYGPIFATTTTLGLATVIAFVGVVFGPRLPGADAAGLVDLRAETGGVTQVASPLVDIRSRLVDRADEEMFTVVAATPAYWRLTALPDFDGSTFRLPTADLVATDAIGPPLTTGGQRLEQQLEIAALGGRLVPAAADPVAVTADGLRWSAASDTLVDIGAELTAGDRYTIVSELPLVDPIRLAAATNDEPPPGADVTAVPDDLDPLVSDLALAVAGSATSGYDAARALQDWFRNEFTYDLDIAIGHDNVAIVDFLEVRRGYCEQFAATFAVMARTLGLPARVAVGYTPGSATLDASGDTVYEVAGRHAHAWPEVWFDGIGWVPFEPTPGRGAPGAEAFTGIAAAQDGDMPAAVIAPTTAPDSGGSAPTADDFAIPVPDAAAPDPSPPGRIDTATSTTVWWWLVLVIAVIAIAAIPALVRRIRRWHLARTPIRHQVVVAWSAAITTLRRTGIAIDPWMTSQQIVTAASRQLPTARRALGALADAHDLVVFGPGDRVDGLLIGTYGASLGRDALGWSRQIRAATADRRARAASVIDYLRARP